MTQSLVTSQGDTGAGYQIQLRGGSSAESVFTLGKSGRNDVEYAVAKERSRALWQPSGKFVVITDQSSRFSRDIYILSLRDGRVEQLQIPDYVQNALGRVKATEIYQDCVSIPKAWTGDDLSVMLYFSAQGASQYLYSCEVVLHLDRDARESPVVRLKSVSEPVANEG